MSPTQPTPPSRSHMDRLRKVNQSASGWMLLAPGEFVRAITRLDRRTLAWGAIGLAAVICLAANIIVSTLWKNTRLDLTEDHLFTISAGTQRVLAKIEEPINIRVYFSKRLGDEHPQYLKMFERARALLEQYRDISGGKLKLAFFDPEPYSEAEERATAGGLSGRALNQEGDRVHFGLIASDTTDKELTHEFFNPERERFLEYDLTKLVFNLANPHKPVVGLITGLPLEGAPFNPMMGMRQPQPQPWLIVDLVREFYDIRTVAQDVKAIPPGIDVLLIVQPDGLTKEAAYAIDQFALGGGRVLAFLDPNTFHGRSQGMPGMPPMPGGGLNPEMGTLLKAWGVAFDPSKVVGDIDRATPVQFGPQRRRARYVAWMRFGKADLNEKEPMASGMQLLNILTAGALDKEPGATTEFVPILQTTPKAMAIDAGMFMSPDPQAVLNIYKEGGKRLTVAARVSGDIKTAFPGGLPKPPEKKADETKGDDKAGADKKAADTKAEGGKSTTPATPEAPKAEAPKAEAPKSEAPKSDAAAPAEPTKTGEAPKAAEPAKTGIAAGRSAEAPLPGSTPAPEAGKSEPAKTPELPKPAEPVKTADDKTTAPKAAEPKSEPEKPQLTSGKLSLVVVADTDMLHQEMWAEVQDQGGQQVAVPNTHNPFFLLNALEYLVGGEALSGLRGRGITDRPFALVDDIRKTAEARFGAKLQALIAKRKETQTKLGRMEVDSQSGASIMSDKQRQEIDKYRAEAAATGRELRDVLRAQREDIDSLYARLRFWNIAFVPLAIGVGGLVMALLRRRRHRSA